MLICIPPVWVSLQKNWILHFPKCNSVVFHKTFQFVIQAFLLKMDIFLSLKPKARGKFPPEEEEVFTGLGVPL